MRCPRCNHNHPIEGTRDGQCDSCGFLLSTNVDLTPINRRFAWQITDPTIEVVTIASFNNAIEASFTQQELKAEGITAFLGEDFITGWFWQLTIAVGWIKLRVPAPQVEQAISVLADSKVFAQTTINNADDIVKLSQADQLVERMFRLAMLGLLFFVPLQLYSVWLFVRLLVSGRRVTPSRYWKIMLTVILDMEIIMISWLIFTIYSG